jgi:hypothetical protein
MTKTLRHFLSCCLTMSLVCLIGAPKSRAQTDSQTVQPHPVNLDFEQGTLGQVPNGWVFSTAINYGDHRPGPGQDQATPASRPISGAITFSTNETASS